MEQVNLQMALKEEITKCRGCKITRSKINKTHLNNLPQCLVDLICSYLSCKKCSNILYVIYKEPDNLTNIQLVLYYFTSLNSFPSKKCINDNLDKLRGKYDRLLNIDEQDKLLPINGNKYKYYREAYQKLYCCSKIKPYTHKERIIRYIDFMLTHLSSKIICLQIFKDALRHNLFDFFRNLDYDHSDLQNTFP